MKKIVLVIIALVFFCCNRKHDDYKSTDLNYEEIRKTENSTFSSSFINSEELNIRLNYLNRVILEPFGPDCEIYRLQYENFEWMLFTYAFTTYAYTNLILTDKSYFNKGKEVIKQSINRTISKQSIYFNVDSNALFHQNIPDYSVLFLGHLNLMIGCYRLISNDNSFNQINKHISESLIKRYNESQFMMLESYDNSVWIADNTVAMASLKLFSHNEKNKYDSICSKWIQMVKAKYVDSELNVLYSKIDPESGEPIEEPRGSMLGWSIMFINQFDSTFAKSLYLSYKKNFSNDYMLLRFFRERHDVKESNMGDIDSGPIVWGFSIPANQFALGCAIISGDFSTANKIKRLIDIGTEEVITNEEFKYKTKYIDINISPMAEALVLFSLTLRKWI